MCDWHPTSLTVTDSVATHLPFMMLSSAPLTHLSLFPNPPSHGGYGYQGGYNDYQSGYPPRQTGSGALDEVEIRQLLISHVGHRCCWGNGPARRWKITSVEDCNVYVGTLETFFEERDTVIEKEPYLGGEIDGADKGQQIGIWELDLRSYFLELFIPDKEIRIKIPHSEAVHNCPDCKSRGETMTETMTDVSICEKKRRFCIWIKIDFF